MLPLGIGALIVGGLTMLFGFFGDTTIPSSAGGRSYNIGLIGQQAALVTGGAGVAIVGAIFVVGGVLSEGVGKLLAAVERAQQGHAALLPDARVQPLTLPTTAAALPPTAEPVILPSPGSSSGRRYPNNPAGWRALTAEAEKHGWTVISGLSGVRFVNSKSDEQFTAVTTEEACDRLGL